MPKGNMIKKLSVFNIIAGKADVSKNAMRKILFFA